jgi:simple sugar transport system ATP-binding protein
MIELTEIYKSFGSIQALEGVNLKALAGSIHGIVGENGAGKSTLMKILTGFTARTGGDIFFGGEKIRLDSPRDAIRLGIGMLYQEPLDFPQLSVLDNFMAGRRDFSPGKARAELTRLAETFCFHLDPVSRVESLTVGERQQLELLRLIDLGVRILILDEPTTGISLHQQELLFSALRKLKGDGATILLVSHKLDEIDSLCDTVTVLRHGRVAALRYRPFDRDALLEAMFDILPEHHPPPVKAGGMEPVLEFDRVISTVGRSGLKEVSIAITAGEVVGLAGVDGSGQTVFLKTACGLLPAESGRLLRFGRPLPKIHDRSCRATVFLPADRLAEGLFPGMTIREHHILAAAEDTLISAATGLAASRRAIAGYNIKGAPETTVEELSGGNQQRLLLSLIPEDVRLILMENPTRGLDVQSAAWTWHQLHRRQRIDGAIVFASPDLEEIMAQATRVVVFYNGEIILDTPTRATDYQEISRAITGQVATRMD